MSKHEVQCLWEVGAQLGEGPLWVAEQNRLYFVDLKNQTLHSQDVVSGQRRSWSMPDYICWLIARRRSMRSNLRRRRIGGSSPPFSACA